MKKVIAILALASLMVACGGKAVSTEEVVEVEDTGLVDTTQATPADKPAAVQ